MQPYYYDKAAYHIKEPALNNLISPSEGSRHAILQTVLSNGYEIKEFQLKTIFEILRFANIFNRTVENHLKRYELSHGKFGVLLLLLTSPDVVWTPAELAANLGCTRSTITGLLEGLERAGWIEKTVSSDDRRSFEIVFSKKGKKRFLTILPDHFKRVSTVVHGFSESDAEDARNMLNHLAKNLELMKDD